MNGTVPPARTGTLRRHALPRPERRGLNREEAADYVGVGASLFDRMVADGRMPRPKRIDGRIVWDRYALDDAFAALPDDGAGEVGHAGVHPPPGAGGDDGNPWDDL